jgi:hypothetical protein
MEQNISDDVIVKNLAVEIAELLFKKGNKYLSKKKPENYNEEESK